MLFKMKPFLNKFEFLPLYVFNTETISLLKLILAINIQVGKSKDILSSLSSRKDSLGKQSVPPTA
ncbi:hypothetical protein E2320_004853, partial [Naja naja]